MTKQMLSDPITFTLPAVHVGQQLKPQDFWQIGENPFLNGGFRELVSAAAPCNADLLEAEAAYCDLLFGPAADADIRLALPEDHLFETNELLARLQALLQLQVGGREGVLFTGGYVNLFYTKKQGEVLVVFVRWNASYGEWGAGAGGLDVRRWGSDARVFSRNCFSAS